MATKQYCDRCNKDITKEADFGKSKLALTNGIGTINYDLCDPCRAEFSRDFMNPPRGI